MIEYLRLSSLSIMLFTIFVLTIPNDDVYAQALEPTLNFISAEYDAESSELRIEFDGEIDDTVRIGPITLNGTKTGGITLSSNEDAVYTSANMVIITLNSSNGFIDAVYNNPNIFGPLLLNLKACETPDESKCIDPKKDPETESGTDSGAVSGAGSNAEKTKTNYASPNNPITIIKSEEKPTIERHNNSLEDEQGAIYNDVKYLTGTATNMRIIEVYQNDRKIAITNTDDGGHWEVDVALEPGPNSFHAVAWNPGCERSEKSDKYPEEEPEDGHDLYGMPDAVGPRGYVYYDEGYNPPPPTCYINDGIVHGAVGSGSTTGGPSGDTDDSDKLGRDSNDWRKKPTFGKSWEASSEQIVQNGFAFNGHILDITDNWHTDFELTESIIGDTNHVDIKVYSNEILQYVTLSLGVPQVGDATNAETDIIVNLQRNYNVEQDNNSDSDYTITEIHHEQTEPLINEDFTRASISKIKCIDSSTNKYCHTIAIDFTISAPLKSNVLAISAGDGERHNTVTYINDGVAFTGDSLLEPAKHELFVKKSSQEKGIMLELVQLDRRYALYEDQFGNQWTHNSFMTWNKITPEGFERFEDTPTSHMTRMHSAWNGIVEHEVNRATSIFDSSKIQGTPDEPHTITDDRSGEDISKSLKNSETKALELWSSDIPYYYQSVDDDEFQ